MSRTAAPPPPLGAYDAKRNFGVTSEPSGAVHASASGRSFVIQKHDARRLHFDFRLELDGVLKSWAVPKGPSLAPGQKRLAVEVEDHPVDYRDFEGTIPEKQYGAGPVIVWDRGSWSPIGDPHHGLAKGHLEFQLEGERLHGAFTLIRLRSDSEKKPSWLLMKRRDEFSREGEEAEITQRLPTSILTGRTIEEVRSGKLPPRAGKPERGKKTAAAARVPELGAIPPQLATLVTEVPTGPHWTYEQKLDGYRALATLSDKKARIASRSGKEWTTPFAQIASALGHVRARTAVFDGEICYVDERGRTDFQSLQNALSSGDASRLVYYVFDLLFYDGVDLREQPLRARRDTLRTLLAGEGPPLRLSEHIVDSGPAFFAEACKHGLEGIVAKRDDRPYRSGRSTAWVKVKCQHRQELVIVGFSAPRNARTGFGALLLGVHEGKTLRYVGKVGTGFSQASLDQLTKELSRRVIASPVVVGAPRMKDATWVVPELVCEVRFTEWTRDGKLRHPSFEGMRADKSAKTIVCETPKELADAAASAPAKRSEAAKAPPAARVAKTPPAPAPVQLRRSKNHGAESVDGVVITHPDRVIDEESGITKLDLARYYASVAPLFLAHATDRPLALVRCPQGTSHKCFFQKHAMLGLSNEVKRGKVGTEQVLSIASAAGLVELAQFGVIELHGWGSTLPRGEHPDWIVIDLDPDEGLPFARVIAAARRVRAELLRLQLTSFVKTTGGKGLHVVVPLHPREGWGVIKGFSQALAESFARAEPAHYTATIAKKARTGRIFVDYLRNAQGATAILPYAVRARAGAPVAMPIAWNQLDGLDPHAFTVKTVPALLARRKVDPWAALGGTKQELPVEVVAALKG